MKKKILLYALLLPACAFSCEPDEVGAIIPDKSGLHGIEFRDDVVFQDRYTETKCLRVTAHSHRDAGLICRSRSNEFLIDNGIDAQDAPDSARTSRSITISTPTSLYEMQEKIIDGKTLYMTDIDCDEQNGAIYRPTSTCSVAYWPLNDGKFIYTNMTVENHASNQQVLSRKEIDLIIRKLKK